MRYLVLLTGDPPRHARPDPGSIAALSAFEADLDRAGVLLAAERLRPSWSGTHLRFPAGGPGRALGEPAGDRGDPIAGFFLIDVRTAGEAAEWSRRCPVDPAGRGGITGVELREVAEGPGR